MISSLFRKGDIIIRRVQRKFAPSIFHHLKFSTGSFESFPKQLVDNIRWIGKENDLRLPCFALSPEHLPRILKDPHEFHQWLCQSVSGARERVLFASLYMGNDDPNKKEEQELTNALIQNTKVKQKKILLDANRAKRSIPIIPSTEQYFFATTSNDMPRFIPNIMKEVLGGVFHIKVYIIDDQLVLSGANLSQEYFTTRQDRYINFPNGGAGLVDFYAQFIEILCNYAHKLPSDVASTAEQHSHKNIIQQLNLFSRSLEEDENRRLTLIEDLNKLFFLQSSEISAKMKKDVIAYAIPTYQAPTNLLPQRIGIDYEVIRNLITYSMRWEIKETARKTLALRLSSAYLNPTNNFLNFLNQFSKNSLAQSFKYQNEEKVGKKRLYLMTAALKSHGFAPKNHNKKHVKDFVPHIFMELLRDIASKCLDQTTLLYQREGWTFHAKGLWLTATGHECDSKNDIINNDVKRVDDDNHSLDIDDPNTVVLATMIGSSNYGTRSELLDIESNCLLVLNHDIEPKECNASLTLLNSEIAKEWNYLSQYAEPIDKVSLEQTSMDCKSYPYFSKILSRPIVMRTFLNFFRRYC